MNFKRVKSTNYIAKFIILCLIATLLYLPLLLVINLIQGGTDTLFQSNMYVFLDKLKMTSWFSLVVISYILFRKRLKNPFGHYNYLIQEIQKQTKLYKVVQKGKEGNEDITEAPQYFAYEDSEKLFLKVIMPTGMSNDLFIKTIPLFENAFKYRKIKVEENFSEILVVFVKQEKQVSTEHLYSVQKYPVFGFNVNNEQIVWNFDEDPHLGVYASPGSGKSVFTKQVVKQLADLGAELRFIDFKRVEFGPLKKFGYQVANDSENAFELIKEFQAEMMARYDEMENRNVVLYRNLDYKPWFLVFDEFASMADSFPADKDGKAKKAEFMAIVGDIVRLGRAAGIFLIVVTQRPDTNILPGEIRSNLNKSVVLRGGDSTIRRMAFGDSHSDLSPLKLGYAYVNDNSEIETIKIPFYNADDFINDMERAS